MPSCFMLQRQADGAGLLAGLGEDGEEDGSEDRDDRDNDEQLDQGKCLIFVP